MVGEVGREALALIPPCQDPSRVADVFSEKGKEGEHARLRYARINSWKVNKTR
jgi:hypothetical protein